MTKVVVIIVNSVTFFAELNDNLIYLHLAYIPLRDFFLMFDIFSIDQSPEIAGKLNNYVLDYK